MEDDFTQFHKSRRPLPVDDVTVFHELSFYLLRALIGCIYYITCIPVPEYIITVYLVGILSSVPFMEPRLPGFHRITILPLINQQNMYHDVLCTSTFKNVHK